ncbi:uncharacterized protein EV422DRAFT_490584, partial [Fimicolochytrium jonesii]|uniref:uncharacterized protein n=1 Tax=Fimicolochytrium jonesii TaxID=1396493 RepID=UPI0022FF2773
MPVPAASLLDEHGAPRQNFPTNAVYTSKYTAVTFLPKTLFEQFRRVANLYFLGLTILQFFPKYTTMNPFVSALPLVVIVGLTIVKDGFEDWKRHQSDAEMNATEACCLRGSGWRNSNEPFFHRRQKSKKFLETRRKSGRISPSGPSLNGINRQHKLGSTDGTADNSIEKAEEGTHVDGKPAPPPGTLNWAGTPWSDIETGDLILLKNDTAIPADVLILATSEPEGLCYVETKNLDGETNLKIRQGVPYTSQYLDSEDLETLGNLRCIVTCEKPNNSLYTFTGTLAVLKDDSAKDSSPLLVPLSIMNVLLRGCYLRNTEWAVGLVLQTGASTKIRQNSGKTPMKRSNTEGKMNTQVLVNLGVLFLLCLTTCIVNPLWERSWSEKSPLWLDWTYIHFVGLAEAAFDAFWNSIIIYQNVVPLSLYITIEIVKTAQAYFIYEDMDMFYPPTHRCIPRSWAIADDLGQIDYVFSDKTGTLTRNIMEFKKFSVSGVVYGEGIGQVEQGDGGEMCVVDVDNNGKAAKPAFWDSLLGLHMSMPDTTQYAAIGELFTALAICHSVLVSKDDNGDPVYKASSPDEAALVDAARLAGYTFVGRDNTTMTVRLPDGSMKKYELMNVLEFNSTRKRMSVIVRTPEKQLWLICKGADSVIWPRLTDGQETVKAVTEKHLEYFAEEGLRTLSVAGTILAEEAYLKWMEAYQAATVALDNRESRTDAVTEEIERNMQLIGATAIEDKLQDGVPECIATLMSAGIKVWVLTGDKLETAINIGLSCNLLTRDMHLILVRGEDGDQGEGAVDAVTSQLEHALQNFFQQQHSRTATQPQFQKNLGADLEEGGHISGSQKLNVTDPKAQPGGTGNPPAAEGESYGLVIDGAALLSTLHNEKARTLLLKLATLCSSVICCRVSPLQKAQIVNLVKTNQKAMCLAIGDGANDVSMIQAAHIGIGIAGEEGLQAAMASDYAIAQFRFLSKLLLVHGRWSYRRTADMILCFFFKNIIWVMVLFWYQIYCGFSAQAIYDSTYTLLYNVVFTALPVITLGVFDQDILAKYALVVPPVYQSARQWTFSYWRFVGYMLDAFYQSLIIIFMVKGGMDSDASMWKSGRASDLMVMGTTAAITAVINANLVVVVNTNSFSWITWLAYSISEAIVVAWTLLYSFFPGSTLWGIIGELVSTASFWLTFALITVLCQLPKLAIKYGWRILWPTDTELVQ